MRIVLRRRLRPKFPSHAAEYRQSVLRVARLKIGRGADQHVQLDHPEVGARHAILYTVFGRLRVRAVAGAAVFVNGMARRGCTLRTGDRLTFGAVRLTIEQRRRDGVIVLRLNDPAMAADRVESADDVSLKGTGLDSRAWSWRLVLAVLVVGLGLPGTAALVGPLRASLRAAPVVPSDTLWMPGPLHAAHRAIGDDCNVCHTERFRRVTNAACEACHQTVQHHVVAATAAKLFTEQRCADCHAEHDAQKSLIDGGASGCVACHEDLRAFKPDTALGNVADFSRHHPDFALTLLMPGQAGANTPWRPTTIPATRHADARQSSNLTFSHQVHLDPLGVDSPDGRQKLDCGNCHQTDSSGRAMQPIRMETHCERCHTLQFDEKDPRSKVPHGDLPQLYKSLQEHFSRRFLDPQAAGPGIPSARRRPGDEERILTRDEQRRALQWADGQSLSVLRELLEKRVCVECHKIARDTTQPPGVARWRVEPVHLTEHWFPKAQFSHAVHETSACSTCHRGVTSSDDSSAIHMPNLAACRECHGDGDRRKVASTCIMCHDFHNAGSGPFTTPQSTASRPRDP